MVHVCMCVCVCVCVMDKYMMQGCRKDADIIQQDKLCRSHIFPTKEPLSHPKEPLSHQIFKKSSTPLSLSPKNSCLLKIFLKTIVSSNLKKSHYQNTLVFVFYKNSCFFFVTLRVDSLDGTYQPVVTEEELQLSTKHIAAAWQKTQSHFRNSATLRHRGVHNQWKSGKACKTLW